MQYNEYNGIFDLRTLELLEGDLPNKAIKMIQEWASNNRVELERMWDTKDFIKPPGLD